MSLNRKEADGSTTQVAGIPFVTKENIGLGKVENKSPEELVAMSMEAVGYGGYVTPQMFGAVADGKTDDYNAFVSAIASGRPIYIPYGEYYISEQIVFSGTGSAYMCGVGSGIDVHLYLKKGIKIAKDNVRLANFWLHGDNQATPKVNNAITFAGNSNGGIFSDLLIAHYNNCISNEENGERGYTFGNKFDRIRVYSSEKFLNFEDRGSGYNCYNNSFNDCWMLTTNRLGKFDHCRMNFENCILYVTSVQFGLVAEQAEIEFNSCTFETSRLDPESAQYIFYNEGFRLVFRNCNFVENVNSNIYWFVNTKNGRITLSECTFVSYSPETKSGGLLNITYSSTCKTGSIEVDKLVMYREPITVLTNKGVQERTKFNIIDGIGITISGMETDLRTGVVYSKVDNYANFIGKFLYNGQYLVPISPNEPSAES